MTERVSDPARRVLVAVAEFIAEKRYSPTVRELGDRLKRNPSTVHSHLEALKRAGLIDWDSKSPRTIRIRIPAK